MDKARIVLRPVPMRRGLRLPKGVTRPYFFQVLDPAGNVVVTSEPHTSEKLARDAALTFKSLVRNSLLPIMSPQDEPCENC